MKKVVFGHKNPDTDSICSSIAYSLGQKEIGNDVTPYRLGEINKETQYILETLNINKPELLEKVEENMEVVMVDHNEFNQSIDNIRDANIKEVYDHHRFANFETTVPLNIVSMPVGCTSTVLYQYFTFKKINITKTMASLMLSAIISDTLLFKSPTCTQVDIDTAQELEKISGINVQEYGMNVLKAGTDLDEFSEEQLLNIDTKAFETDKGKYEVGQINTADIDEVLTKRDSALIKSITTRVEEHGLDAFMFVITDIVNSNSIAYVIGNNADQIASDFKVEINDHKINLPGVVSRKKQVVPFL